MPAYATSTAILPNSSRWTPNSPPAHARVLAVRIFAVEVRAENRVRPERIGERVFISLPPERTGKGFAIGRIPAAGLPIIQVWPKSVLGTLTVDDVYPDWLKFV